MNTLGRYNNDGDERGHYTFGYYTEDGKHVNISFRAEPDYDLDIIFAEIKNFLIASGHDIEGDIGELGIDGGSYDDEDYANPMEQSWGKEADKFSMDHLPNNGWPFGGLTSQALPTLSSADLAGIKPIDFSAINQFPTMSPITQEQIKSWKFDAPGTIGGAKIEFK